MFAEADDWGDDEEDEAPAPAEPASSGPVEVAPRYSFTPALAEEATASQKGAPLAGYYIASVQEPREPKPQAASAAAGAVDDEAVLRQLEKGNADVVERSGAALAEEDAEEEEDPTPDEFVERISRAPRQCLRWQPEGFPIVARREAFTGPVDSCGLCGRPRVFECQVMSPAIYFLCGDKPEAEQPLHFSTILVFTCSAHCYDEDSGVVEERAVWHEEL
jgi:hypothetical protein